MWCCKDQNDDATKVDKKISKDIRTEQRERAKQKPIKLLLLGIYPKPASVHVTPSLFR